MQRQPLGTVRAANPARAQQVPRDPEHLKHLIARFFADLRRSLGITQHQAAAQLLTHPEVIDALENGLIAHLPPWPETTRIVMAYAGWARVDGRPALAAIAELAQALKAQAASKAQAQIAPPQTGLRLARPVQMPNISSERIIRAGTMIARNASRLPKDAFQHARQQPVRALYAVSLPVAVLIVLLNTSLLNSATKALSGPLSSLGHALFGEQFLPMRDGFRWIDAADPRERRGDRLDIQKLHNAGQPD
jgi:hypothetical protein